MLTVKEKCSQNELPREASCHLICRLYTNKSTVSLSLSKVRKIKKWNFASSWIVCKILKCSNGVWRFGVFTKKKIRISSKTGTHAWWQATTEARGRRVSDFQWVRLHLYCDCSTRFQQLFCKYWLLFDKGSHWSHNPWVTTGFTDVANPTVPRRGTANQKSHCCLVSGHAHKWSFGLFLNKK